MIILITGASHTGKTVLAQRLLSLYHYPYFSIDHLKMGLIRSGNTDLTPCDDDRLTTYLWPIVREMVKTAIENKQDLIVEGCYIPYNWRDDFAEEYLNDIRFICLAFTDNYIGNNFGKIVEHASDVEKRLDDSDCTIEWIRECNHEIIEGFTGSGEEITLIDSDYESSVARLLMELSLEEYL